MRKNEHKTSQNITLLELHDTFIDGRVSISLSMTPATKGSLLGVVKIKGDL